MRVVELAQWVFVPVAGALLADWGADVVHIEPTEGDPYRGLATQGIGTDRGGVNLSLALANRGKRSIALDIQSEDGRAVLHRLLESADVFLTNMRPKALRRLGLDAETLTERYPSLVCAMGSGYGARGPDADRAGLRRHGLLGPRRAWRTCSAHPNASTPSVSVVPWGTATAPWPWPSAWPAALLKRSRTGRGSVVDVSLLATAIWTLSSDVLAALGGDAPAASSGRGPLVNPLVGVYRTKDGRHIQLVFLQPDRYWAEFCRLIGREDLSDDPRFADMHVRRENGAACVAALDEEFAKRTFAEWKELLVPPRRALGSGAVRSRASRRSPGDGERIRRRRGDRRRGGLPPPGRAGAVRRAAPGAATSTRARGGHGSAAESSSATDGTTSPRSRRQESSFDHR